MDGAAAEGKIFDTVFCKTITVQINGTIEHAVHPDAGFSETGAFLELYGKGRAAKIPLCIDVAFSDVTARNTVPAVGCDRIGCLHLIFIGHQLTGA